MLEHSNSPGSSKRLKRPRQSTLVFVLEMISAVAGAGAVIVGGMYILGRFCWWAVPGSTGSSGKRGCGDLAQYNRERMADPAFVPPEIVSFGEWKLILIAIVVIFGAAAFVIDRTQRGPR